MSKFLKAVVNIILLAAILSAGALLIPPLLGVTTKVSDGTGNTNLSRGSVTYATSMQASQLETGDKILQENSSGSYVYTVTSIAADTYTLTDEVSNETQDQQLTGGVQKVVITIPVIGMLSLTLQTREGVIILGLCVAFLIILFILSEVWRRDEEEQDDEDDEDEDEVEDEDGEDQEESRPLSRKEKRRLKKEARRKAREAEEDDEDEEEDEDDVTGEDSKPSAGIPAAEETTGQEKSAAEENLFAGEEELTEDGMTVKPLEEELIENPVVDTSYLTSTSALEADRPDAGKAEESKDAAKDLTNAASQESSLQDEKDEMERSLPEAVGALLRGETEDDEEGENENPFPAETTEEAGQTPAETAETPASETAGEDSMTSETETVQAAPVEENAEEPIELAMPVLTAEELLKKAEEAGDHPEVIEDKETGVTILDYSDIL